jgi:hypothetical protein
LTDEEMARAVRDAVDLVLAEFLGNAPAIEDARYTIQAAFIMSGLDSMLKEHGSLKAAQTLFHGFQMTSGQDIVSTLYGREPGTRLH